MEIKNYIHSLNLNNRFISLITLFLKDINLISMKNIKLYELTKDRFLIKTFYYMILNYAEILIKKKLMNVNKNVLSQNK